MLLYTENDPAPNPRRVRLFLAAKGAEVAQTRVKLRERAHKTGEFRTKNSLGQVPVLELNDGTAISESVSICRYLESLFPDPPLFGTDAKSQALIDMWIRRVELVVMSPVANYWRHAHPATAALVTQFQDFGRANADTYAQALAWLDRDLGARTTLTGTGYTMADIALITTVDFAALIGLGLPETAANVARWRAAMAEMPGVGPAPPVDGLLAAVAQREIG